MISNRMLKQVTIGFFNDLKYSKVLEVYPRGMKKTILHASNTLKHYPRNDRVLTEFDGKIKDQTGVHIE